MQLNAFASAGMPRAAAVRPMLYKSLRDARDGRVYSDHIWSLRERLV
jgi:hypothetical protein